MKKTSTSIQSKAVLAIVIIIMVGVTTVGGIGIFGAVRGEEFSPTSFKRRSFSYFRLPVLRIQVTPVFHTTTTGALEKHIAAECGLAGRRSKTWDVVRQSTLAEYAQLGPAYPLCACLDFKNSSHKSHWLAWSQDNPELADVLWPVVVVAAADRKYVLIPRMMAAAEELSSPQELAQQLETILQDFDQITPAS